MAAFEIVVPVLFFLTVGGIVALVVYYGHKKQKRIEAWVAQQGWSYEKIDRHMERGYRSFRPFGKGSGKKCKHIVRGTHEAVAFTLFEYQYTVSSGKDSQTYYHLMVDVPMPIDGPGLSIEKEHIGHKIFDALGGEDIDFESAEFSKRFWVRCRDRRFAYDVIHPRMMEWLLGRPDRHWQWQGRRLLVYETGRFRIEAATRLLDDAVGFHQRLPRHRLATD